jgi:type I restriction enzyme, R subunit
VTDVQLIELERTLRRTLGSSDIELTEENIRKAYGMKVGSLLEFLRNLFELETIPDYKDIVRRQFEIYISAHQFNADQIRFLRAVQSFLLQKHQVNLSDLYESPFTSFGNEAVERLFTPDQVTNILDFTDTLAA